MDANQPNINRALDLISEVATLLEGASPSTIGRAQDAFHQRNPPQPAPTPNPRAHGAPASVPHVQSTSTAYQQQTPSRNSTVIAELRRNFEPYRRPVARGRFAGRPANHGNGRPHSPWSHRFCCLGGPEDISTPNRARLAFLQEKNLGNDHIFADRDSTKEDLVSKLEESFPLLRGVAFEMLQATGTGGGTNKSLRRISSQHSILSVPMIVQSRILSIIYIRPTTDIVPAIEDEGQPNEFEFENSIEGDIRAYADIENGTETASDVTRQTENSQIGIEIFAVNNETVPAGSSSFIDQGAGTDRVFFTLEDLRQTVYIENPGEQLIAVQRDEFCYQVLGSYKNPAFDLLKKPLVVFIGEAGRDVGALTKEYFWKGINAILEGKICNLVLFEGETDHKLPSCDAALLRSGKFKEIGKFIGHSALHSGVGFFGLSPAVVEYICAKNIDSDTILPMSILDVPDFQVRNVIQAVDEWLETKVGPESPIVSFIREAAIDTGFHLEIKLENLSNLKEQLLYYHVIEKRKAQLDSIKEGFKSTPVFDFLTQHNQLIPAVFPSTKAVDIPLSCILEKMEVLGDSSSNEITQFMTEFIRGIQQAGKTAELLSCWTGWPILSEGKLKVKVLDGVQFMIRSCFSEIEVPRGIQLTELANLMNLAVTHASAGFGSI